MATPKKVIREYHNDASFKERFNIYNDSTEYQLCLAFATDSGGQGNFTPQWDTQQVTPYLIQEFKQNCLASNLSVKVFVTIGGNDTFKVGGVGGADQWIANATNSLKNMIQQYNIDGIDVNYIKIQSNTAMFVNCIKGLIEGLRQAQTGLVASLAPDVATNEAFYLPLYQKIDNAWIGTVVFQCFVDFDPETNDPVGSLVAKVEKIALRQYSYYGTDVLLGYSAINSDWSHVSLPIFLLALYRLVRSLPRVTGASVKVISDTTASFPATWIPQYLSLAGSDAVARP